MHLQQHRETASVEARNHMELPQRAVSLQWPDHQLGGQVSRPIATVEAVETVELMQFDVVLGAESRVIDPLRGGQWKLGWLHPLA
jgi:hypothetical protein